MDSVKISRERLLTDVMANRNKHADDHKAALVAYKEAAVEELKLAVEELQNQAKEIEAGERTSIDSFSSDLPVPDSHEKDYAQVVKMLEMSADTHITLTDEQFSRYVMDDWEWKRRFEHVKYAYSVYGASGPQGPTGATGPTGDISVTTPRERLIRLKLQLARS